MVEKKLFHQWIIAPYHRDRENARVSQGASSYQIDCHQNHRGPFTGAGELLRAIVPEAYQRRPDLVHLHTITLLPVAPELKSIIPVSYEMSRSLANVTSDDGFYPYSRTHRLADGLVDFLLTYLAQEQRYPATISFENVHLADPLDQEFMAVLLRRADPASLLLRVGTVSSRLPEPLSSALQTYAWTIQPEPMTMLERQELLATRALPDHWATWLLQHAEGWQGEWMAWQGFSQELDLQKIEPGAREMDECLAYLVKHLPPASHARLARTYIETDCTSDDPFARTAYQSLEVSLRQRLHEEQAVALEKQDQASLHLGAIPYHYEHAGPEVQATQGAQAFLAACESCMVSGYYEYAVDLGYRGRKLIDRERQKERYWLLTKRLIAALFLLNRLDEGENLCSEVQAQISDPSILMTCTYFMGILYARFHKNEKRDYHLARKWIQKSIEYAESLPEQEQRVPNVNFLAKGTWALTELRAGHPYEAIELITDGLERLRAIDLEKYRHCQRDIEIFLYNRARLFVETDQLERAIEDYTSAIGLETYTTEYFFCRGNILQQLGRYREALADYNAAILWSPPYPEVYYNRASVFAVSGRTDQALADYTHVIELDPDFVDALINRASLLYGRGEYAAARRDAEHALTLKPDDAQLLCVLGLLERAEHHTQEAHRVFTRALEHDPTLLAAWTNRAILLFEEGKAEAAIDDLTHALSLCEDATTLLNRAWIYRSQKRWQEAIDDYSRALALSPKDAQNILSQRDRCYQAQAKRKRVLAPGVPESVASISLS